MKMRNKGKVYPSPSSSSSSSSSSSIISSSTPSRESLSILKLLPAAILALVLVLSLEDREVFAYMITRSMKSAKPPSISTDEEKKKKYNKKSSSSSSSSTHKPPVFDCECFDCYTSYWFRWDSSLNRELIHQAIEAFEDHLATGEQSKRKNSKGKRRERMGRHGNGEQLDVVLEDRESCVTQVDDESFVVEIKGKSEDGEEEAEEVDEEEVVEPPPAAAVVARSTAENNHRGLARKVLPDVVGLLNSRLWSLWSPNV